MLTIKLSDGDVRSWPKNMYDEYDIQGRFFVVIRGDQWVGMYGLDSIVSVEVDDLDLQDLRHFDGSPVIMPERIIGPKECADAMLMLWIDEVLTDREYYEIMDKLNANYQTTNYQTSMEGDQE